MRSSAARSEDARLYEQVAAKIARLIEGGTLRAGDRIPSVRQTSQQHGVSISTVLQAFFLLENRGLVEARPQSGFYVKPRLKALPAIPKPTTPPAGVSRPTMSDYIVDVIASTRDPEVVPLGAATICWELLPVSALSRLIAQLARDTRQKILVYDMPPGNPALRRQISLRSLDWEVPAGPEEVLTTCGGTEALNLCLQAVTKPGDTVAIESPCYYGILQILDNLGCRTVEIATDPGEGLSLSSLSSALKRHKIKAVVSISNFNNPLGSCMPEEKKRDLVRLLTRRRIPLIEDDIYGDLCFGESRPKTAKSFDREGWVLLCSAFSKTLAPGFRVGWTMAGRFRNQVEKLKIAGTMATATLPQMALAEYLQNGGYDRHLRQLRRAIQIQVERCIEGVAQYFPADTRVTRPSGGCVLWVEFPKKVDALKLHAEALAAKISIAPGPIFSPKQKYRNFIRLNAGHPWSERIEGALRRLGELARNQNRA
ncbi:MAG TPA: PLP-dependent aminotransferase family protein [bacterium]|nr:PLP-dependent aminotransferase family protein [bacterium]